MREDMKRVLKKKKNKLIGHTKRKESGTNKVRRVPMIANNLYIQIQNI